MMISDLSTIDMVMYGRTLLFTIVAISGSLFLALELRNAKSVKSTIALLIIVIIFTAGMMLYTSKIENFIRIPPCCGLGIESPKWGYPYYWIGCMDSGIDSCPNARTEYSWFAFAINGYFWASLGITVYAFIKNLPLMLGITHAPPDRRLRAAKLD